MIRFALPVLLLCVLLAGCGYATFSAPQLGALRALLPAEEGVDLKPYEWRLSWGGESQPVVAVTVPEAVVFTHRNGVAVTFDGWQVTRVEGLLGDLPLELLFDESGAVQLQLGARRIFQGQCSPWQPVSSGFAQECEGLGLNEIRLDEEGNITALSFIIHPDYNALVLQR
jgi:hypothetical protein